MIGRTLSVAERVMEAAPGCPFKHASIAGVSRTTAAHGFALRSQGSNENSIVLFFFFFSSPPIGALRGDRHFVCGFLASVLLHCRMAEDDDDEKSGDLLLEVWRVDMRRVSRWGVPGTSL